MPMLISTPDQSVRSKSLRAAVPSRLISVQAISTAQLLGTIRLSGRRLLREAIVRIEYDPQLPGCVGELGVFVSERGKSLWAAVPSYRQMLPAYVRIRTAGVYFVPASAFL